MEPPIDTQDMKCVKLQDGDIFQLLQVIITPFLKNSIPAHAHVRVELRLWFVVLDQCDRDVDLLTLDDPPTPKEVRDTRKVQQRKQGEERSTY